MSNFCQTCGGQLEREGNYYVCDHCGNKWEIDVANDIHAVERSNAWSTLRDGDFEKAAELFDNLLLKDNQSYEAYWGRALALTGIVYVTDMNENKKVPTCNNITEESFLQHKDVQKALQLAPWDIADSYRAQAGYIENVRTEWLEKASKEPAYDVFISFKDSDRENGIERTQDSIDAQDLYNALVADGYKVFFSRISLRDKIAEQYEPYIYNAIKTAKVMIVFGEKPEYFSSVWIKNEWSRFKTRIEKGEKHKNSLVVVYKNMNPGDLPVVLKSRQCLNAAEMTFLPDLTRHIQRVIAEMKGSAHLDRIKIEGSKVAKKADRVAINTIQTREIGQGALADTDLSNQQFLSLTDSYLKAGQWAEAGKLVDEMLFDNPTDYQAVWRQILVLYQSRNLNDLFNRMGHFTHYDLMEKLLNTSTKDFAPQILDMLYASADRVSDESYLRILELILPYYYENRQERIHNSFQLVASRQFYQSFLVLLNTLDAQAVDSYIQYNLLYADHCKNPAITRQCLARVLEVDNGNVPALRMQLKLLLQEAADTAQSIAALEELLKYTNVPAKVLEEMIRYAMSKPGNGAFIKEALRYHEGELSGMQKLLVDITKASLQNQDYENAQYYCNLLLSLDKNNANTYWLLCLAKAHAADEDSVVESPYLLNNIPEFTKYLVLVNENRRHHYISLAQKQKERLPQRIAELEKENRQLRSGYKNNAGCFKVIMIYGFIAVGLGLGYLLLMLALNDSGSLAIGFINFFMGLAALILYFSITAKGKKEWKKGAPERKAKLEENEALLALLRSQNGK